MKKRGITPLIAWVLLFGFAVAAGAFIYGWVGDWLPGIQLQAKPELYCDDVQISFENSCRLLDGAESKNLNLTINNKGSFTITRLTVQRTAGATGSCLQLIEITPSDQPKSFEVPFNTTLTSLVNLSDPNQAPYMKDCVVAAGQATTNPSLNFTEISIIPWISKDSETFPCVDKKITLNNIDLLNRIC